MFQICNDKIMPSRVTLPPLTVQVSGDGKGKGGAMRSADKRAGRRNSPYDKKGKSPKKKKAVSPGPLSSGLSSAISKLGVASATRSRTKAVWPTPALPDSSVFGSGGARGVVQRLQESENLWREKHAEEDRVRKFTGGRSVEEWQGSLADDFLARPSVSAPASSPIRKPKPPPKRDELPPLPNKTAQSRRQAMRKARLKPGVELSESPDRF